MAAVCIFLAVSLKFPALLAVFFPTPSRSLSLGLGSLFPAPNPVPQTRA